MSCHSVYIASNKLDWGNLITAVHQSSSYSISMEHLVHINTYLVYLKSLCNCFIFLFHSQNITFIFMSKLYYYSNWTWYSKHLLWHLTLNFKVPQSNLIAVVKFEFERMFVFGLFSSSFVIEYFFQYCL